MRHLTRCVNCDEIYVETPVDLPEDEPLLDLPPRGKDTYQDFIRHHRGHRLEDLNLVEDSYVSDRPYSEPVKVSFFKVTNGKDRFVVRQFRKTIEEPLRYELVRGDYSLQCVSLEIESEAIRKQIAAEFKTRPLPASKVETFLRLYRHIASTLDVQTLERIQEESATPLTVYYRMDDVSLGFLLRNCRNIFQGPEYGAIVDFIHRHRDDGVLLLKGTHQIRLVEGARKRQRTLSEPLPASNVRNLPVKE